MPNDLRLQEGHPVDENLRPIKVGGEVTALEVSKKDVRVNNLYVNGTTTGVSASDATKLPLAGGTMTGDITTDSNIVSTDLTIDDAGTITLDSHTGAFITKKAGTEFSVANSAYAGMILGYTTVGIDAAADSYTLTSSMVVTDSAHKVKFVAPPSGVVEIFVQIYFDAARRLPVLGLSDNATYNALDVAHEHLVASPPSTLGDTVLTNTWVITGLTSGTAYEWWLGAKTSGFTGGALRWGGDATNLYSPFIMKAIALPTAVTDFAVYG